jgi:hypothetical protein
LYPARVHSLSSESEGGKTWLALAVALTEMDAGRSVVYLDFEDGPEGVAGRLVTMGARADLLAERFAYLSPSQPLGTGIHRDDLVRLFDEQQPSLVVIDGVTEAMGLHGLDPLSNRDAATFGRLLPRLAASSGAAVLLLDHVTKSVEGRGRYAVGAVHKLNAIDGAALLLENRKPFGVGLTGRSTLRIAKDRPGQLRRRALPSTSGLSWLGDLVVQSHGDGLAEVWVEPPAERAEPFRPTHVMGRVMALLVEGGPLSQRSLRTLVGGKAETVSHALALLVVEGYVTEKSPHEVLKPWTEEES